MTRTLTPDPTPTPTPNPNPNPTPNPNQVVTRFLFVFPHGLSVADHAALRTTNDDFTRQVRACIEGLEREAMSVQ